MKKRSVIPLICAAAVIAGCASASQNSVSQQKSAVPRWIEDKGRFAIFPDFSYVSQIAYGSTALQSKENAAAALSAYIKASVSASESFSYFCTESEDSVLERKEFQENIQVSSNANLYKLEYTAPFYDDDLGQYACVAYINREQAFDFVRAKLEIAKNQFPKGYRKSLEKQGLLDKIIGIKHSQSVLHGFYEVYDFARAVNPEKAKAYEEVDFLASESVLKIRELCSSVLIRIEGAGDKVLLEKSGAIAELANQFRKIGFVVSGSNKADCAAFVEVKSEIAETRETFETYPEIYIRITENGSEKISYAKKLSKVAGFDRNTVERRTNLALTEEIRTSFLNECF